MAQTIKLKRGTTTPTTSNIVSGEVAIDTAAQKLYINDAGTIKEIGGGGASGVTNPIELENTWTSGGGLLPHFTSATNGTITVSSAAVYSTGYEGWRAFDSDDTGTLFHSLSGSAISSAVWLQVYDSSGTFALSQIRTKNRSSGGQGVATEFDIYGTNDGTNLTFIETLAASTGYTADGTYVVFTGFNTSTTYKGYRFVVTALAKGGSAITDGFWEATDFEVTTGSSQSGVIAEIEATGSTTDSVLKLRQYESSTLTEYQLSDFATQAKSTAISLIFG